MAQIVAVHGIGQQLGGEDVLKATWLPSLRSGLRRVGATLADEDLECAFYGDLFRRKGTKAVGEPPYDASDVSDPWEQELLQEWWREAAATDEAVVAPDARTKVPPVPYNIQRALNALSYSKFFARAAEPVLIFYIKQVLSYLGNQQIRRQARERVAQWVSADTKVLIGHSLGSVVAYEALCEHSEWSVSTFVTLGSPLGIRNLIFDRLQPAPYNDIAIWPGAIEHWTNIADRGDIVALVKELRPLFGERVEDLRVDNEARAHDVSPYLTAEETGRVIARGLAQV